jgi:hypothetical protein
VLVTVAAWPAVADAATYCVRVEAPGCEQRATADAAFQAAAGGGADTILLGRLTESGSFADAPGQPLHVAGAGRGATVLGGTLDLADARSSVASLTAGSLALAGTAADVAVRGATRLRGGARLRSSAVAGVVATAGQARMESVAITGPGVDVESGALTAGHLTVLGSGAAGVRVAAGARATVANSIVWGFASGFTGAATVTHSHLPGAPDPAFVAAPGDLRLRADSPLIDAGDPAPLTPAEPHEDALGDVRAVDGNGDGTARRDVGALERRPPAPPGTDGNVLENPGAEQGPAASDDTASFRPPGWTRTGGFTSVRYGAVAGGAPFPSLAAADALGAGRAFFAGGPGGAATLTQVVDVSRMAPEIDGRVGGVRLSALLGGYRGDADAAVVAAEFRDPSGAARGTLALDTVTPAERAAATMLSTRAAEVAIPPLTRTIAVTIRAGAPAGRYSDAYADDVALAPRYGRVPGVPPPDADPPGRRRRFAGVAVVARRVTVGRKGRAGVRLACGSRTAGRCSGVVTLTRGRFDIVGSRRFALRPGRARRLGMDLARSTRRLARRKRSIKGHVYTATRDGQGLTRTKTAPVRIAREQVERRRDAARGRRR